MDNFPTGTEVFENRDSWLEIASIEISQEGAAVIEGIEGSNVFKKATEQAEAESSAGRTDYIKAADLEDYVRVFGRRLMPSYDFLKSGKTELTEDDILKYGKWGIHEVDPSGVGFFRIQGHQVGLTYRDEKRWLNLSKIMKGAANFKAHAKLQRGYPGIGPRGSQFYSDYIGDTVRPDGSHAFNVKLPLEDNQVARNGVLQYGDTSIPAKCLLDDGAYENEVSYDVATQLGLFDDSVPKRDGGAIQVTGGSYRVFVVDNVQVSFELKQLLADTPGGDIHPGWITDHMSFRFPERPIEATFPVIIGRQGLRILGFRIYV